jgi:hypothetical protein
MADGESLLLGGEESLGKIKVNRLNNGRGV